MLTGTSIFEMHCAAALLRVGRREDFSLQARMNFFLDSWACAWRYSKIPFIHLTQRVEQRV
jgi:hypothetical protein